MDDSVQLHDQTGIYQNVSMDAVYDQVKPELIEEVTYSNPISQANISTDRCMDESKPILAKPRSLGRLKYLYVLLFVMYLLSTTSLSVYIYVLMQRIDAMDKSLAHANCKGDQVKDGMVAFDNNATSLTTEQMLLISEIGQQLTSPTDQLKHFRKNNNSSGQEKDPSCLPEWNVFGNSCYFHNNCKMSWMDAMIFCIKCGGYLAEVDTEDEDKFIINLYNSTGKTGRGPWIGGYDGLKEGKWVWYNSGTPISYTNWGSGEPNGDTGENCLHYMYFSERTWNDSPCLTHPSESICEMSKNVHQAGCRTFC